MKRLHLGQVFDALLPLLAVVGALMVGAIILLLLNTSPLEAYQVLITGAFTNKNGLADTLVKAVPLRFVAGAKAAKPDVTVNVSYTGSFGDTALAAEAAKTHINAGADVLTGSAQQVVGAIGVVKESGVLWLGTQSDQSSLAPDNVVSTQVYDWYDVVVDMITKHQAGELGGTAYVLDLKNGGLHMNYNEKLAGEAITTAQEAEAGIVDGSITVLSELK